jgi:hypothetical protein
MSKKIVVGVLRRQVSDAEKQELEKHFPGCELEFHRMDSCDYHEHANNCRELKPDLVLLPLERPIPSVAMEEGFKHVALIPGQGLKELKPLHPDFKDFNSKQITCEHTNRERTGAWSGWTRCTDCDLSIAPPKPVPGEVVQKFPYKYGEIKNGADMNKDYDLCPEPGCGKQAVVNCKCMMAGRICPNNHQWHLNQKDTVTPGDGHD